MLVFSCHADTGFGAHSLKRLNDGLMQGQLDNYIGVYSMMKAYFSGRLDKDNVRVELTYDEEGEFAGAYEVLETLSEDDVVFVVDVTATPTTADVVFEKCSDPELQGFIRKALDGLSYDLYDYCPDPVSSSDESDVYMEKLRRVCFLGVPVFGGDYNSDQVMARQDTPDRVAEVICRLVEAFGDWEVTK